jgi:hypothetical protein
MQELLMGQIRTGLRKTAMLLAAGLVAFMVLAPASAQDSKPTPPTNLKKVGDHWTPWDPPAAGPEAYVIEKGDNFWNLAQEWLGDPYLWPQIWDENRYVLDSHWIYPGDPLVIPGMPTVVPAEGPPPTEDLPTEPKATDQASGGYGRDATGADVGDPEAEPMRPTPMPLLPLADATDLYCSGHITPEHELSGLTLTSVASEKYGVADGDVVYLNHGRDWSLQPGDEFAVVRPTGQVAHPETGRLLGTYLKRLGKLRIMLVHDDSATAVIENACQDIEVGDDLLPWAEIPVPMARSMPDFDRWDIAPSGGATGTIVSTSDKFDLIGVGNVIHTDLGASSGVRPGDVLTLYRHNNAALPALDRLQRLNIAQAVVLTVEPTTSTIKVTHSVQELFVGDQVEVSR